MPRRTSLRRPVCAAVSLAFFAANAGQGVAQDDGVHVDPDSPAGKEYALPLDTARRAAEGGGSTGGSSGSAPLFGAGISHKASDRGSTGADGSSGGTDRGDGSSGSSSSPGATGTQAGSVATAVAQGEGGMSAGLLTALIALGVVGVGLAVGLSLRSLRSTGKPS